MITVNNFEIQSSLTPVKRLPRISYNNEPEMLRQIKTI